MSETKIYKGIRQPDKLDGTVFIYDSSPPFKLNLPMCSDIWNHSDGFNWGYGGSGPAQLALALLYDVTNDEKVASEYHQTFKWDILARLEVDSGWELSSKEITEWLKTNRSKI